MTQYIAFLRGINVGGHNVVKKENLQDAFLSFGFTNVTVYKQSGNVLFETATTDLADLQDRIQVKLLPLLGINVKIFIRTMSQLQEIVRSNPFRNIKEGGASFPINLRIR